MTEQGDPSAGRAEAVVRRLLDRQFPEFSDLPLTAVESDATDNAVFRLGADLVVRLPRNADAAERLAKELRWLPEIARHVSVAVPTVVGAGRPQDDMAYPWLVQRWIQGRDASAAAPGAWPAAADALGRFVLELRAIDAITGPAPSEANAFRGVPLADLDERVRWGAAVTIELGARHPFTAGVDVAGVLDIWQDALAAPPWAGAPTWVHGDLLPGNVLLAGDALAAVIDFGCAGVGDPACDGLAAWTLFRGRARERFLTAGRFDDTMRARARGWAVYVGITAAAYHHVSNPSFCTFARRVLDDLLAAG